MLVLSRKLNESIRINDRIMVKAWSMLKGRVWPEINASRDVTIRCSGLTASPDGPRCRLDSSQFSCERLIN